MAEDRLDCLRPPKSFGYRIWAHPDYVDPDWRRSQSSERIDEDSEGRVLREPILKSQLTPTPPPLSTILDTPVSPSYDPTIGTNSPLTWDRDAASLRDYSHTDPSTWTAEIMLGSIPYNSNASLLKRADGTLIMPTDPDFPPFAPHYSPTGPNFSALTSSAYTPNPPHISPADSELTNLTLDIYTPDP